MLYFFPFFCRLPLHTICLLFLGVTSSTLLFSRVPNVFYLLIFCQFNIANNSHSDIHLLSLSMVSCTEWKSLISMIHSINFLVLGFTFLKLCFRSPSLSLGHKDTLLCCLLLTLKVIELLLGW